MPTQINACSMCSRYIHDRRCGAYSKRIPDVIWKGRSAHTSLIGDEDHPVFLVVPKAADARYLDSVIPSASLSSIQVSP